MDKKNNNYTKITRDITILIGTYEVITGIIIFGVCYKYKPTQTFFKSQYGNNLVNFLKTKYKIQYEYIIQKHDNILSVVSKNYVFNKFSSYIGLRAKNSAKACAEGIILKKLLTPINLIMYANIGKYVYRCNNIEYNTLQK